MVLIEEKSNSKSEFVFSNFDFSHPSRVLRSFCKEAKITEITFHCLRHVFASHLAMSGIALYELQKLLGHQSIQMTERYSHLLPGALIGLTEVLTVPVSEVENVINLHK